MSNKKKLNREIRQRYEREREMEQNPDTCFCEEPDYDEKQPIGETGKVYYSIYDYKGENPFSLPIYKCNKCGKNHVLVLVYA